MDWEDAFPMGAQDVDLIGRVQMLGSGHYQKVCLGSWEIDTACRFAKRTLFDKNLLFAIFSHAAMRKDLRSGKKTGQESRAILGNLLQGHAMYHWQMDNWKLRKQRSLSQAIFCLCLSHPIACHAVVPWLVLANAHG